MLIAGDLVPTNSNIDLFSNAQVTELFGEDLLELLGESNIRIFNLEVPITDNETPIKKCGPNLITPTSTINGIKALNPTLITLANNHILDQGIQGLRSTKEVLQRNNIPFVGIGNNINEACMPYILGCRNKKIGIYACAENEFSIATETSPGANPFDLLESFDHIVRLKSECDYVIILYHGGKEHYRYPSPYLQRVCRKMVQKGADLIICQHSHCIGCFEEYNGATIVYGQGNFIFDLSESEYWKTSILVKVSIEDKISVHYIPITKLGNCIRLANVNAASLIMDAFHKRSNEIKQKGFIENKYRQFAKQNYSNYIRSIAGIGKFTAGIDSKLLKGYISKHKYTQKQLLAIQNYIECEAHRELFLTYIKETNGYR